MSKNKSCINLFFLEIFNFNKSFFYYCFMWAAETFTFVTRVTLTPWGLPHISHIFITQLNFHWFETQVHKVHMCHGLKALAHDSKKMKKSHAQSCNEIKTEKKRSCNLIKFYPQLVSKIFPLQDIFWIDCRL